MRVAVLSLVAERLAPAAVAPGVLPCFDVLLQQIHHFYNALCMYKSQWLTTSIQSCCGHTRQRCNMASMLLAAILKANQINCLLKNLE